MPLVSMNEFFPSAKQNRFAVGQFNMNNLEFAQAIVEAGIAERSPFIFGVSEGAIKYMGLEFTVALAKTAADISGLPIALHLDHGSTFEVAMKCIRAVFLRDVRWLTPLIRRKRSFNQGSCARSAGDGGFC